MPIPEQQSTADRPRRRWYQFSLRTLLIFVTVVGVGLGWLGMKVQQALKQKAVVDVILKSGGMVAYDYQLDETGRIWRDKEPSGPAWLRSLLKADIFANVIYAVVETNDGLIGLADIGQLKTLQVGPAITDGGWEHLVTLRQIDCLCFGESQISDDSLKNLTKLRQLTTFKVLGMPISDAGIKYVTALDHLQRLDVSYTNITDAGLTELHELKQLEDLRLIGTSISDKGIDHLLSMRQLQLLDLRNTKVSDEGVRKIRDAIPNCKIVRE